MYIVKKAEVAAAFGEALRRAREGGGWTQERLALTAGLDRTYISLMERSKRAPTLTVVFLLATILGVSVTDLMADADATYQRNVGAKAKASRKKQ